MLYEIMLHLRNFFVVNAFELKKYKIEDSVLTLDNVPEGAYVLIEGSMFNDGVFKTPLEDMTDEEFVGYISVLNPPKDFLNLSTEIKEYTQNNVNNGLISESFGGYSYTKAQSASGGVASWQDVFKSRLNTWRKL